MTDTALRGDFYRAGKPIYMVVHYAVLWMRRLYGLDDIEHSPKGKLFIHDLMHILADATSGRPKDEMRAGMTECHMLSFPINESSVLNRRLMPNASAVQKMAERKKGLGNYPVDHAEELGKTYVKNGKAILEGRISALSAIARDLYNKDMEDGAEIKKLIEMKEDDTLTPLEIFETNARARILNLYFQDRHGGRKLDEFSFSDIAYMDLKEFGIQPVATESGIRFLLFPELERQLADEISAFSNSIAPLPAASYG